LIPSPSSNFGTPKIHLRVFPLNSAGSQASIDIASSRVDLSKWVLWPPCGIRCYYTNPHINVPKPVNSVICCGPHSLWVLPWDWIRNLRKHVVRISGNTSVMMSTSHAHSSVPSHQKRPAGSSEQKSWRCIYCQHIYLVRKCHLQARRKECTPASQPVYKTKLRYSLGGLSGSLNLILWNCRLN